MITDLQAIVLAAGKSKRCKTDTTKLAQKICGQEMVLYSTRLLEDLCVPTTVVVGFQKNLVRNIITKKHRDRIHFVIQEEQHGTGHAILCARDTWEKKHILIMNADAPLVTEEILQKLYDKHISTGASVSFVIAHNADPSGKEYGRIIKKANHVSIVEAKEFDGDMYEHCYVNAGIYIVTQTFLEENINEIEKNETSKEFYITDLVRIASDKEKIVATISAPFDRIRGINTFQELWAAEQVKRAELIRYWMERGVRFSVAQNVHIDLDVSIGSGSEIGCGAHIQSGSKIGKNCDIHEFSTVQNAIIGDNSIIYAHCILRDTSLGENVKIGPFAHITEKSTVGSNTVIGNFVEIKRSSIGKNTKAKHLAYIGDATIGENVNIGAGTITCNHNGSTKEKTIIENGAYIGSNNSLVAPITIGENAFTAAGSVITQKVPRNALAIGRSRQLNKEGYAKKIRQKKMTKQPPKSFLGACKTSNDSNLIEGT